MVCHILCYFANSVCINPSWWRATHPCILRQDMKAQLEMGSERQSRMIDEYAFRTGSSKGPVGFQSTAIKVEFVDGYRNVCVSFQRPLE